MAHQWEIRIYITAKGRTPYRDWYRSLETTTRAMITNRLDRLQLGAFGDCKHVGNGVYELRIHHGSGYRIYFGKEGGTLVLLLHGGEKGTQKRDIAKAQEYWRDYKEASS